MSYLAIAKQFLEQRQKAPAEASRHGAPAHYADVCPNNQHIHTAKDLREHWLERAGIMEYDGGLSRADANRKAVSCMPQTIDWPTLPSARLIGEDLEQAWSMWWRIVEDRVNPCPSTD
jgi:hypothetical protein